MPDNMTYEQGALMEPIAVAVHSVDRSPTTTGSHVVVIGAGTVGLLVAAAAYAKGATRCVIIDINPDRLEFAKTYLPQIETILLETKKTPDSEQTPIQWAADQAQNHLNLDKHTIDVVFECTGVETCVVLSVHLVRGGGAAMLVGMGKGTCTMPTDLLTTSEITVLGTFRYSNTHPKAIELVSQGKIPTKGLVSHKFALKDSLKALDLIKNGEKGLIKIQIGDF
jgi:threonine dehydrogenase-like Zn-dependent dehydrogenase